MSNKDELKQLQINTMQQVTGSTFGPTPSFYSRQNSNSRIKTPVANQSTSFAFNNYNLDQQHYDDNLYLGSSINESNMSLRHNSMIKGHSFQQQQNFADRQIPMNSKYYKRESVLESQVEDDSLKEEEEEEDRLSGELRDILASKTYTRFFKNEGDRPSQTMGTENSQFNSLNTANNSPELSMTPKQNKNNLLAQSKSRLSIPDQVNAQYFGSNEDENLLVIGQDQKRSVHFNAIAGEAEASNGPQFKLNLNNIEDPQRGKSKGHYAHNSYSFPAGFNEDMSTKADGLHHRNASNVFQQFNTMYSHSNIGKLFQQDSINENEFKQSAKFPTNFTFEDLHTKKSEK